MNNAAFMKEADNILKMLDDLQENNPEEYDKFIKKTLEEGKSEFSSPTFRFAIHAKETSSSQSVCKRFINICSFPAIPPPKSDEDPISVFGGSTFNETLNGEPISIDFLGINPKVMDEIGEDKQLRKMLIKLAIDYYNDIFQYKLSYDCGLSKKQVGDPKLIFTAFNKKSSKSESKPSQLNSNLSNIKLPFADCDEGFNFDLKIDNSSSNGKKSDLIKELNDPHEDNIKFEIETISHPKNCLKIRAKIDFIESINDIDLEIVKDEVVLTTDSFSKARCKIPSFDKVIEDSIRAKFTKSKVLTITVDLKD